MSRVSWLRHRFAISALLTCVACADAETSGPTIEKHELELDDMGAPPKGMELLLLATGADSKAVDRAFDAIGSHVVHRSGKRLLVVENLPAGADSVLRSVGVRQRFARAVSPRELAGLSVDEGRFVRVFSNRYYPEATPREEQIVPTRAVRRADEPFEQSAPETSSTRALKAGDTSAEEQERNVFVPYASGRIVVSIILPESNGRSEPSTEDWNEDTILESYTKVQAALEAVSRHEPNSKLDFVQHYASAPASRGLAGTVDLDWEYGKRVAEGANLGAAYAQIFSGLLGRPVTENEYYEAQREYLNGLRDQYAADGAFIIFVAPNQNFTASFRAYAYFNGPITNLHTAYGYEVFMHEFGHIFGAADEYCPDACNSPSGTAGYLGVVNANAQFRPGSWGGIQGGRGESQPSLMMGNVTNGVNGYTRGAWGWIDSDGDGVVEVRDTKPDSDLVATLVDGKVHLTGRVVDLPATPLYAIPYSVNRLRAVHVRAVGAADDAWVRFALPEATRGRELVDLNLGALPAGSYQFEVRAENSAGNLEDTPQLVAIDVPTGPRNGAPLVSLEANAFAVSPRSTFTLRAHIYDPEGRPFSVRFDLDGDGRYDTAFSRQTTITGRALRTGRLRPSVEVRDDAGLRAQAQTELYVLERNAPAHVALAPLPSPVVGTLNLPIRATAESVDDPERTQMAFNFVVERDDAERSQVYESGFGTARSYDALLTTPPSLPARSVDLSVLDRIDPYATVFDVERITPSIFALALGDDGVMFVDLTHPRENRLITRLQLETGAFDLLRSGSNLVVLGDKVALVDVRTPTAPVEVLQRRTTRHRRSVSSDGEWPVSEEPSKSMSLGVNFHERIEHVRIEATFDHPNLSELTIALETPDGQSLVLWNHGRAPRGVRTLRFDERSHPVLAPLVGTLARGEYRLSVIDDVVDGDKGSVKATLSFDTAHRGFETLAGATQLVGLVTSTQLLIAGEGLALVDTTRSDSLWTLARFDAAPTANAVLRGGRVFVLAQPIAPEKAEGGTDWSDAVHGLYALDVTRSRLRLVRADLGFEASSLTLVGSRMYLATGHKGDEFATSIGDQERFLAGQKYWIGQSTLAVGLDALGDDQSMWNVRGAFERLDVADPNNLQVLERFDYPYAPYARFFDAQTAFALGSANELSLVDLANRTGVISEVYRVTLDARDADGAVSKTTRSVHVVPYDHAPSITSARIVAGGTTRDNFALEVTAVDPDARPTWDNLVAVRIDWEGDGAWDGTWQTLYDGVTLNHAYELGGDYDVRLQARDGFYALSEIYTLPVHVEQYVPVTCVSSDSCPEGEYCELSAGGTCGEHGRGTCERVRDDCYGGIEVVCGCDGRTYRNPCEAQAAGASVAQAGVCPGEVSVCGGADGAECSVPGMFCRYPVGETPELSCGAGGVVGECSFAPNECYFLLEAGKISIGPRQVCGCDDVTYRSYCEAEKAGVSIKKYGSCEPDCRDLGCAAGETCQSCFINWVCVPEGTSC